MTRKKDQTSLLLDDYEYRSVFQSNQGDSNAINQDAYISMQAISNKVIMKLVVLGDGIGGLKEGEVASAHLIRRMRDWFNDELKKLVGKGIKMMGSSIIQNLKKINYEIYDYGQKGHFQLGTTCTLIFILNQDYVVVHIGDSRLYSYHHQQLKQITCDDSLVELLYHQGMIKEDEKAKHPQQNVLTKCIGVFPEIDPQIIYGHILNHESFLLCSDGFTHEITQYELIQGLKKMEQSNYQYSLQQLQTMIDMLRSKGEKDNISVGIIYQGRRDNYGTNR